MTSAAPHFWPAAPEFRRVRPDERAAMRFDRGRVGAPQEEIGWSEAQKAQLVKHACDVRIRLRVLIDRLADRGELALVVGVSRELLDRAFNSDMAGLLMRSRAELGRAGGRAGGRVGGRMGGGL